MALSTSALLGGCDLKPAPKQRQAPAATKPPAAPAPTEGAPDKAPVPGEGDKVGVKPPPVADVTPQCLEVGTKVAEIVVQTAKDDQQRAVFERERTKIVRRTAEACTNDQWSEPVRKCFLDASTQEAMQACGRAAAAAPAAGSAAR